MKITRNHLAIVSLLASGTLAHGAIVFSQIDLVNNTITLTNTGASAVDLGGWRFCSHDIDSVRVYSSSSQFNGISILSNESYVVDTTDIPFAGLLGGNTLSVGLYNDLDGSLSFGSANDLSAFIQFAPEGTTEVGNAEFRTHTAVEAGLWDANGSFVQVGADDTLIQLNDLNSSIGSTSFSAIPEPSAALLAGFAGLLALGHRRRPA
ncbi:hypothetical protein [Roseibacillus persicicus]|uniref:LTD domain-containing protein n=1 Tax=Roseibacillus persicicus TaxID=454148 RepID=A0A918TP57_9BACT|nr:hypothetical protein [Roseibacillus persicicus]GHC54860.1 hypothetical protein GCM10007100_21750 [Roseibacillus persicicus]